MRETKYESQRNEKQEEKLILNILGVGRVHPNHFVYSKQKFNYFHRFTYNNIHIY